MKEPYRSSVDSGIATKMLVAMDQTRSSRISTVATPSTVLRQEVNLSRRACRATVTEPTATNGANPKDSESAVNSSDQECSDVEAIGEEAKTSDYRFLGNEEEEEAFGKRHNSSGQFVQFRCSVDVVGLIGQVFLLVKAALVMMGRLRFWGSRKGRSVGSSRSFSKYLVKVGICVAVVTVLLAEGGGFVLARPNRSNVAGGSSSGEEAAMASEQLVATPGLGFGSLGPSESQLKRSAELASIVSSTVPSDGSVGGNVGGSRQDDGSEGDGGHGEGGHASGGHEVERYPVTQVEFSRVETPFVIGVWILSASIAKIEHTSSASPAATTNWIVYHSLVRKFRKT